VSVTTFLVNETLWQTISERVKAANHVDAAIAYFGQGGTKLLRLRSGGAAQAHATGSVGPSNQGHG
jgi:hypothetical protein